MMEETPEITTYKSTQEIFPMAAAMAPKHLPQDPALHQDQLDIQSQNLPDTSSGVQRQVETQFHEATGRLQAQSKTPEGEAVREIPSDEFLEVMENLQALQGRFVDEQA